MLLGGAGSAAELTAETLPGCAIFEDTGQFCDDFSRVAKTGCNRTGANLAPESLPMRKMPSELEVAPPYDLLTLLNNVIFEILMN